MNVRAEEIGQTDAGQICVNCQMFEAIITSGSGLCQPEGTFLNRSFLTQHQCFHPTVISLVHIINLSNIQPMRVWVLLKNPGF